MPDLFAILAGTYGSLALTWATVEVLGYRAWVRRQRAGPGPDRWRLRLAVYAALTVVGAALGLAIGEWVNGQVG